MVCQKNEGFKEILMFYGIVTNIKKYLQNVKLKLLSHKFPNLWWQKSGKFF